MANEDPQKNTMNEVTRLKKDLKDLTDEMYRNNFSAHQDFNKSVSFNTKLKIPVYKTLPELCETGELVVVSGKLYVCSSANTWVVVGTQA